MLSQIASLLLNVVFGLLAGACLLRLYMQRTRTPFANPVGRFVMAVTDWLILPLRRVVPAVGGWDLSSLVAGWLLQVAHLALLWLVTGASLKAVSIAVLAVFKLASLALTGLFGLLIVYVILSWTRADSPVGDVIDRLVAPPLRPIRRVLPLVGGIDLSPLALVVLIQVAQIVLDSMAGAVLRAVA